MPGAHVDNWKKRPERVKGEASKPKGSKKKDAAKGKPGGFVVPFGIGAKVSVNFSSPIWGLKYGGFSGSGGFGSPGFGKNIGFGGYDKKYVEKYNELVRKRNERLRESRENRVEKWKRAYQSDKQKNENQNPNGFVNK